MLRSLLLYRLMLLGPVLFLSVIAVRARFFDDGFVVVTQSRTQFDRITAYVPCLRHTVAILDSDPGDDGEAMISIAREWVSGMKSGELQDMIPAAYEDTSSDGAKELIFRMRINLARRISHYAMKTAARSPDDAARQLALAMGVCEVAKFSDLGSVTISATEQGSVLRKLRACTSRLSPSGRKAIAAELENLLRHQRPIAAIISLSRVQYLDWCQQTGATPLDIEVTQSSTSSGHRETGLLASQNGKIPTFMSRSATAEERQSNLIKELRAIYRELVR